MFDSYKFIKNGHFLAIFYTFLWVWHKTHRKAILANLKMIFPLKSIRNRIDFSYHFQIFFIFDLVSSARDEKRSLYVWIIRFIHSSAHTWAELEVIHGLSQESSWDSPGNSQSLERKGRTPPLGPLGGPPILGGFFNFILENPAKIGGSPVPPRGFWPKSSILAKFGWIWHKNGQNRPFWPFLPPWGSKNRLFFDF